MFGWKKKFLPCLLVLCTLVLTASCGNQKQEETAWKPEGQWSYTPMLSNVNPEDYDIELTLDSTTYSQNTEKIVCTIINKTGLTFQVYGIPMIEKCFIGNQWARLPYEIKGLLPRQYLHTVSDTSTINFFPEFLQKGVTLTPGEYRLVVFLGDGPHYAYFEITE